MNCQKSNCNFVKAYLGKVLNVLKTKAYHAIYPNNDNGVFPSATIRTGFLIKF